MFSTDAILWFRRSVASNILTNLQFLVAVTAVEDELLVVVLVDKTLINGLAHQPRRDLAGLVLLLEDLDLLLELIKLRKLGLGLEFFPGDGFLLVLDFFSGSAPLAAGLQHVGGHALGHWREKISVDQVEALNTYWKHECWLETSAPSSGPWRSSSPSSGSFASSYPPPGR